jgi:Alpha galactosidase A/Cellulose binding domain/Alpha galactosidase C-terminal beta sandwich domain
LPEAPLNRPKHHGNLLWSVAAESADGLPDTCTHLSAAPAVAFRKDGTAMTRGQPFTGSARFLVLIPAVLVALGALVVVPGPSPARAAANNVVTTPPMGWASWNTFAAKINYNVIKQQTDALVSSGLKDAGYQYVNIDEGWWQGTRDSGGNITVDQSEWPGGMKAIADYIHSKGLKAGIYTDAGRNGCGYYYPTGRPAAPNSGSEGHYDQDFLQFSQWGFDFVKVDWCGGNAEGLNSQTAYQAISDSIARATARTGRPMVLSVCNWGAASPWNWAPGMSTMWRTSGDIIYYGEKASMDRVLANFDTAQHASASTPGHYNDPDMLIVGMPDFTAAQNRTHLALWAISAAPLLAGNNLATMSDQTRSILTNREVIAIDQDPLAKQGVKVSDSGGLQVYSKVLNGTGRRAVVLLNRTTSTATMTAAWSALGLSGPAVVRDPWSGSDLGTSSSGWTTSVPAKSAVLVTIGSGSPVSTTTTTTTTSPVITTSPVTTTTTTASATTTSPSASTTGATGSCTATLQTNTWDGGFVSNVVVSAGTSLTGWRVTLNLPAGSQVTSSWNGTFSGSSGTVTVTPSAAWNAAVGPGNDKSFGFQAGGSSAGLTATCAPA